MYFIFLFFKQKTAYEMRISDWSSDVCSSDLSGEPLADRIVTTAPDVTQTTNLGGFVNQRGLFRRQELADVFQQAKIPSAQKWAAHEAGQHIELGIAENNFFLMLASLGLAAPHFGTRLIPVDRKSAVWGKGVSV